MWNSHDGKGAKFSFASCPFFLAHFVFEGDGIQIIYQNFLLREFPNSLLIAFCLVGHHTCRRMDGAYMTFGGHVTDHDPYIYI